MVGCLGKRQTLVFGMTSGKLKTAFQDKSKVYSSKGRYHKMQFWQDLCVGQQVLVKQLPDLFCLIVDQNALEDCLDWTGTVTVWCHVFRHNITEEDDAQLILLLQMLYDHGHGQFSPMELPHSCCAGISVHAKVPRLWTAWIGIAHGSHAGTPVGKK